MDVEEFMWVIQFEVLQENASNTNGLQHQFEDNVHIEGKKFSREQHRHNLELYLAIQHYSKVPQLENYIYKVIFSPILLPFNSSAYANLKIASRKMYSIM
jgi:hypothetical protein